MSDTTVYLIDPYLGELRPAELPTDFIALVDEGLMVEACRLNATDVIYTVEHHVVQMYWRISGLIVYGPGCLIGRSAMGGFLERPTMTIEALFRRRVRLSAGADASGNGVSSLAQSAWHKTDTLTDSKSP